MAAGAVWAAAAARQHRGTAISLTAPLASIRMRTSPPPSFQTVPTSGPGHPATLTSYGRTTATKSGLTVTRSAPGAPH